MTQDEQRRAMLIQQARKAYEPLGAQLTRLARIDDLEPGELFQHSRIAVVGPSARPIGQAVPKGQDEPIRGKGRDGRDRIRASGENTQTQQQQAQIRAAITPPSQG